MVVAEGEIKPCTPAVAKIVKVVVAVVMLSVPVEYAFTSALMLSVVVAYT